MDPNRMKKKYKKISDTEISYNGITFFKRTNGYYYNFKEVGKFPLHRYIYENEYGIRLNSKNHIHHVDFDKNNNCASNLIMLTVSDHMKLHSVNRTDEHKEKLSKALMGHSHNTQYMEGDVWPNKQGTVWFVKRDGKIWPISKKDYSKYPDVQPVTVERKMKRNNGDVWYEKTTNSYYTKEDYIRFRIKKKDYDKYPEIIELSKGNSNKEKTNE